MASRGFLDIGALQRPETGDPDVLRGYLDIGAVQREEPGPPLSASIGQFDPELRLDAWF